MPANVQSKMRDLTTGNEGKLILRFAVPMLLGNVFQQLYNIINSVIVGHYLGKEALAAVGASFPIIFMLVSLIIGIASGFTIIVSQYFGNKQIDQVKKTIDTMYIVLLLASVITTLAGIALNDLIFRITDLPEDVLPEAKTYLNVYLIGFIFFFGFNGISAVLRGLGDSKTPLYFLVIATVANILLDLLFIIVFKWGIAGAAIATIISQAGAFFTAVWYLNKTHELVRFTTFRLQFDRDIFRRSIKIGIPSGLQQTFVSLGLLALFGIVNKFGTNTIAAYSVAARIDSFASLLAMNFSAALTAFVGQNMGAGKTNRVKAGFRATMKLTIGSSLIITAIVLLFGRYLMAMFTPDKEVIEIGYQYLVIVGIFYFAFSGIFVYNGILRGAGDTVVPMFLTIFSLWIIRVPASYLLGSWFGPVGIWWAVPLGWVTGMIFSAIYYKMGKWKSKVIIKREEA